MSLLPVQFLDQGLHRVMFDAMPIPVLVVDEDVNVLEYNSAAAGLLGGDKRKILRRRAGEVLHCVHVTETPRGCGHAPACSDCVIRESVRAASRGRRVTRRWAALELQAGGQPVEVDVRVSCQPFTYENHTFILLMLEGLGE